MHKRQFKILLNDVDFEYNTVLMRNNAKHTLANSGYILGNILGKACKKHSLFQII